MAIDIKYCYSRPELRAYNRIALMNYLEGRYHIPRAASQAPPGYKGEYTADLKEPEAVIESIWNRYQEEGLAGKKMLKAGAPRPPEAEDAEEVPEEEQDTPSTEEVQQEEEAPEEEAAPVPRKPRKVEVDIPISEPPPQVDLQPILDELKTLNKNLGVLAEGLQGGLEEAKEDRVQLRALLEMQQLVTQEVTLPALAAITRMAGHAVGELRGEFTWPDDIKVSGVVDTVVQLINQTVAPPSEEKPKEVKKESPKKTSKRQAKKPPEESGVPEKKLRTSSPADRVYNMVVDGHDLSFTMADLTDKKEYPVGLLNQMGIALGLQLAPVDRVTKISLICESLDQS